MGTVSSGGWDEVSFLVCFSAAFVNPGTERGLHFGWEDAVHDGTFAVGHAAAADVPVGTAVLPTVHWHVFQLLSKDESMLFAMAELPVWNHLFVQDFLGALSFVIFGTFARGCRVASAIDDVFCFATDFAAEEGVTVGCRLEHLWESIEQGPVNLGH